MKNVGLFFFLLALNLVGCVLAPIEQIATDRESKFQQASLERAAAMNEWWGK